MNILLSMPNDHQTNDYIINAIQDLGHEVFFIDHRTYLKECYQIVPQVLSAIKIDLMLCCYLVPGKTYDPDFLQIIKTHYPNVKLCAWLFDTTIDGVLCPENEGLIKIIKEYDYFFTTVRGQVEEFKTKGVNAYFLPEGYSPYSHDLSSKLSYKYDVSFIGQVGHPLVHQDRLELLEAITKKFSNSIIYGPIFTQSVSILQFHKKRPTFNDVEHSKIVAQSKINICHSGWGFIDGYFSARNYKVMGSGGFCLANYSLGIEDFFEVGKELDVYKTKEDCLSKIEHYLNNDSEREKIRLLGQDKVLNNYTFNHSLIKIFAVINSEGSVGN